MKRRNLSLIVMTGLVSIFFTSPAMGAEFPTKPITYIVPWSAGGTDACARVLAKETCQYLGQSVIVENKPGGGGTLGPAAMAASAKPDGYTIAEIPGGVFRYPHMYKVSFDPLKDFTYIIRLTGYVNGILVKEDSPFKTFRDLVAYAKANPGKLTIATTGVATFSGIAMAKLAKKYGFTWNNIPVKGTGEQIASVLGGHVVASSGSSPLSASGLRLITIYTDERYKKYPDVPTMKELDYDGYGRSSTYGLAGPKGMDPKIIKILHDAFKKGMESPAYQKILNQIDMVPAYLNTEDYAKSIPGTYEEEKENVESLGLKVK
jgi:tripartite-type tricarboxylate transporter receptor subunit TctC